MKADRPLALGVERERIFSPGKEEADSLILRLTCDRLAEREVRIERLAPDALSDWPETRDGRPGSLSDWGHPASLILSMAQGENALSRLSRWEAAGVPVINSPRSVLTCSRREILFSRLQAGRAAAFSLPWTVAVDTAGTSPDRVFAAIPESRRAPVWVKRGDCHGMERRDVVRVDSPEGIGEVLAAFSQRGVPRVVLQAHVEGEAVKFYGVRENRYWGKTASGTRLTSAERLSVVGRAARDILGLDVYGGDLIVGAGGEIHLIDINDWPSFTGFQEEAAVAIAEYASARLKARS